jgi:hypothetical protein
MTSASSAFHQMSLAKAMVIEPLSSGFNQRFGFVVCR